MANEAIAKSAGNPAAFRVICRHVESAKLKRGSEGKGRTDHGKLKRMSPPPFLGRKEERDDATTTTISPIPVLLRSSV